MTRRLRAALCATVLALVLLVGLAWLLHTLGVRSFSHARVTLRPEGALPQGATTGGTAWDERMRDALEPLGRLQAKFEDESCAPFGWGRDAAGLRDVLPKATPLVAPFDADLIRFARAFAPTDAVLDELATGDNLLQGWYGVRSIAKTWQAALGAALVFRSQGQADRARDLLLAAWVAGAVLARGMQGDALLFEAMTGLSAQDAAEHELAWLLVEERPGPLVNDLATTLRRLPRAFQDHARSIRGELALIRRLDGRLRRSQGFLGYHALTPFYGTAAGQYEPYYARVLDLMSRSPHESLVPLRAHVASLPERRLHPLVATATPNMGRAWEKNLCARALLESLPLLPDIRRDPASPPDLPTDPLTGEPLTLEPVGDGFTLSAGPAPGTGDEPTILLQVPRP